MVMMINVMEGGTIGPRIAVIPEIAAAKISVAFLLHGRNGCAANRRCRCNAGTGNRTEQRRCQHGNNHESLLIQPIMQAGNINQLPVILRDIIFPASIKNGIASSEARENEDILEIDRTISTQDKWEFGRG